MENEYRPRLLGEYLPCSRGTIRRILQQKREAKLKGEEALIGQLLIKNQVLSKEGLDAALRQQRVDRLGSCPIFEQLSRTELFALGQFFCEVSISADQLFIMAGEIDPTLYVLASGRVEVFQPNEEGKATHIAYVGPIQPIGEMGYFQGGMRTASVRAIEPVDLLFTPYSNLTHYFENVPSVAHKFLEVVKRRQQETEARIQQSP